MKLKDSMLYDRANNTGLMGNVWVAVNFGVICKLFKMIQHFKSVELQII